MDRVQLQWPPCISAINYFFILQLFALLEEGFCTSERFQKKVMV